MTGHSAVDEGRGPKEVAAALREARRVMRRAEKLDAAVANLGDETLKRMTTETVQAAEAAVRGLLRLEQKRRQHLQATLRRRR
jgi:hypothetical protein